MLMVLHGQERHDDQEVGVSCLVVLREEVEMVEEGQTNWGQSVLRVELMVALNSQPL